MIRLSRIRVEKFKRISSVELPLADLNILVGPNACGKSSIIQALHLAICVMRQADRVNPKTTAAVNSEELDYIPTNNYGRLGHGEVWGNRDGSPASKVRLTFFDDEDPHATEILAHCELRSARNSGISIKGQIDNRLSSRLRIKQKFFSAYIPGISGIPNREEKRSKKVVLKTCSYGDSNVILRNALLLIKNQGDIRILEGWMSDIIGQVTIHIDHDEEKHQIIDCDVSIHGRKCPLELVGTGYLQLIQLFCYVLLFKPGILLVDEPDIHLHPSIQENLPLVLARVARERSLRILLTTHSPFIVRGAPVSANVYWVSDGTVTSSNRSEAEINLGWGTFGKKVIVLSEDTKLPLLRKLISQWKNIENFVGFWPGTGYKTLPTPNVARAISDALGNKFKILVHRDRDSLTDTEAEILSKQYADAGIDLWLPKFGDIEAYFCLVPFVAELTNCSLLEAGNYITEVLRKRSADIASQFANQRHTLNQQLYSAGGSPTNEEVWQELQKRPLKGASGKLVFAQLKNEIKKDKFSEDSIASHIIKMELASDLRERILKMIDKE